MTNIVLVLFAGSAMGFVRFEFAGWSDLQQRSHDIFVARCDATPDQNPVGKDGIEINTRGLVYSDMTVISIIKGVTNAGPARLKSVFCPRQGEYYLIFASYFNGFYDAFEPYRIVPVGLRFSINDLDGKTVDEQIKALLRHRIDNLEQQIKAEQEEKARLEEAFKR